MSCEDECDFQMLSRKRWTYFEPCGEAVLWQRGDPVVLWDPAEAELPPNDGERFQRFATVTAVEAAGADKTVLERLWSQMRVGAVNLSLATGGSATQSKVVLSVEAEPHRRFKPIPEVHVQLPEAGVVPCKV